MDVVPTSPAKREGAMWPAGDQVGCWQCGADHVPSLFCPFCDALQPLPERADYFQVLDLPRRLVIDSAALERRYYELSRRVHPDLYQAAPQTARVASLRNTATLNRAYSMLRDPVDRGLYWLALQGEKLGTNNNRVPPELAELVFDIQEKLEELRTARRGNGAATLTRELGDAHQQLLQRQAMLLNELQSNFSRWDAGAADMATLRADLKSTLTALSYLTTLIRDVEKELES
jgi:molecular chaperone HscB